MPKSLTKEGLASQLNGHERRQEFPKELVQAAKDNNLVIIYGGNDDLVRFAGALTDEAGAYDGGTVLLSKKGVPESDCSSDECPYHQRWLKQAIASGEVLELQVFWCGRSPHETMDAAEYETLGKPTWCYRIKAMVGRYRREEIDRLVASFDIFDTENGEREYFCRAAVVDLDELWPRRSYEQIVM